MISKDAEVADAEEFDQLMHGLISVKKADLNAEVRKYERAKARWKRKRKK